MKVRSLLIGTILLAALMATQQDDIKRALLLAKMESFPDDGDSFSRSAPAVAFRNTWFGALRKSMQF